MLPAHSVDQLSHGVSMNYGEPHRCEDCVKAEMQQPEYKFPGLDVCDIHDMLRKRHASTEDQAERRALKDGRPPPAPRPYIAMPLHLIPGAYFKPIEVEDASAAMGRLLKAEDDFRSLKADPSVRSSLADQDLERFDTVADNLLNLSREFRDRLSPLLVAGQGIEPHKLRRRSKHRRA